MNKLMQYKNFASKADFARFLEITPQNLSQWFKRNTFDISIIGNKFPEVNNVWLLTGEGDMLKEPARGGVIRISNSDIKEGDYSGALVYDIDATCGVDGRDIIFTEDRVIGSVNLPEIKHSSKIIKATGDSMIPIIKPGDRLAVREIEDWSYFAYGQIYVVQTTEYRFVKYVRKHPSDPDRLILLKSANPEHDDIDLPKAKIIRLFAIEDILSVTSVL